MKIFPAVIRSWTEPLYEIELVVKKQNWNKSYEYNKKVRIIKTAEAKTCYWFTAFCLFILGLAFLNSLDDEIDLWTHHFDCVPVYGCFEVGDPIAIV